MEVVAMELVEALVDFDAMDVVVLVSLVVLGVEWQEQNVVEQQERQAVEMVQQVLLLDWQVFVPTLVGRCALPVVYTAVLLAEVVEC